MRNRIRFVFLFFGFFWAVLMHVPVVPGPLAFRLLSSC